MRIGKDKNGYLYVKATLNENKNLPKNLLKNTGQWGKTLEKSGNSVSLKKWGHY